MQTIIDYSASSPGSLERQSFGPARHDAFPADCLRILVAAFVDRCRLPLCPRSVGSPWRVWVNKGCVCQVKPSSIRIVSPLGLVQSDGAVLSGIPLHDPYGLDTEALLRATEPAGMFWLPADAINPFLADASITR